MKTFEDLIVSCHDCCNCKEISKCKPIYEYVKFEKVKTVIKDMIEEIDKIHEETLCNIWHCEHWYANKKLQQIFWEMNKNVFQV